MSSSNASAPSSRTQLRFSKLDGHRFPAAPVAASLAAGIAVDRVADLPALAWGIACAALILVGLCLIALRTPSRWTALLLLMGCAALGGLRHHGLWSLRSARDISRFAEDAPLVRMTGTVASPVSIRANSLDMSLPSWRRIDQSHFELETATLVENGEAVPVTGRIRVDVNGVVTELEPGDRVELLGRLLLAPPPAGESDFDFRAYLRRHGIDCLLRCDHPQSVRETGRDGGFWATFAQFRDRARRRAEALCQQHLSEQHRGIGESILLGVRSHLDEETQQAFIESGTVHVLAISGLHVAILLAMVWFGCNLLRLSENWRAAVVLAVLISYTLLTDLRPPVLRAAILGVLVVLGDRSFRPISSRNVLAVSAIVVLLWRPTDLFDAGAQLSFLCVATIIQVTRWPWLQRRSIVFETDDSFRIRLKWRLREFGRAVLALYVTSATIWLATIPLTAWHFQLLTPIGTVLNLFLVPFSLLVLWSGFLFLGVGLMIPFAVPPLAWLFDLFLGWMLACTRWGASLEWGHFFTPAPRLWWVIGFYLLLAGAYAWIRSRHVTHWCRRGLLIWTVIGLWPSFESQPPEELRLSFLPVGHGGSVLIECPSGEIILYDCGSFGDGDRAADAVFAAMSTRGLSRIDALLVSHADTDHYGGVIPLIERVPVGMVCMPRGFLDFQQTEVESTCDAVARSGSPMRILAAHDGLQVSSDMTLRVLHPPDGFDDELDNAESLVLLIEYGGRRILLTGDLEGAGFEVLSRDALDGPIDVLQSPHHGSLNANTAELRDWTDPTWMVVCAGLDADIDQLSKTFTGTTVLSTATSGTVTVTINADGEIAVDEYLR